MVVISKVSAGIAQISETSRSRDRDKTETLAIRDQDQGSETQDLQKMVLRPRPRPRPRPGLETTTLCGRGAIFWVLELGGYSIWRSARPQRGVFHNFCELEPSLPKDVKWKSNPVRHIHVWAPLPQLIIVFTKEKLWNRLPYNRHSYAQVT